MCDDSDADSATQDLRRFVDEHPGATEFIESLTSGAEAGAGAEAARERQERVELLCRKG